MSRAGPLWAGSAGARFWRGWWVLHTRAHRVLVGTAESCGTATPVTTTIPLPCAQTTLTAHRSPTTTHHAHQRNPQSQQKTAPAPQRPRSPMCNTQGTHTRSTPPPRPTPRSVHFRREIGPIQPGQPDVEARTTSSRAKATCHTSKPSANSRPAAARPISTRNRTDLGAGFDRSRRGDVPISARGGRRGERVRGPSASVEGDERKPRPRLPSPCSPVRRGRCGRPPPPARAWGARRCRGRTARRPAGR